MSILRTTGFTLCMIIAAGVAHAQQPISEPRADTLTILKGDSPSEVRVRLVSTGAHVHVAKLSSIIADTLELMTPVQVVIPAEAFSLTVSSPADATGMMLVDATKRAGGGHFRNTIHAPFTLLRTATNAPLSVRATGRVHTQHLP